MEQPKKIHAALIAAMREAAQEGVGKDKKNAQQGFAYRSIDGTLNVMGSALSRAGVFILPEYLEHALTERTSKSGGGMLHAVVRARFAFVADDGSSVTAGPFIGEAMDSGDKALGKAQTYALKVALFQVFCIPVEGQDPDANTHEVAGFLSVLAADLKACADKAEVDAVLAKAKDAVGSLPAALKEQARKLAREAIQRVEPPKDTGNDQA